MKKYLLSLLIFLLTAVPVSAEFFPDIIVTSPDGIWTDERAYTDLATAITAIGADRRTIVVASQENVVDLDIPANISLDFKRGGSINNTGILTIHTTSILAPSGQEIFSGTGEIDFAVGTNVRSSWFGDLNYALSATEDNYVTLIIDSGWAGNVSADRTVGNNVVLKWEGSGHRIVINAGFTLSNIRNIEAGNYQIFSGSGDLDFLDSTQLRLSWFNRLRSVNDWVEAEDITLIIDGTHIVDFDETLTANILLDFKSFPGVLSIPVGVTLTIPSPSNIIATNEQQIKAGTGDLVFSYPGIISSRWFPTSAEVVTAAPRGSEILFVGDYDIADYGSTGFVFTHPVHIIGIGGWSRDNANTQYGARIINSGGDVVDAPVIYFDCATVEYGASISNLSIIHEGATAYAVRNSNVVYTTIERTDIELSSTGYGGVSFEDASYFATIYKSKIRNFTDYGVKITGTGSAHKIFDSHISSSVDVLALGDIVGIYTDKQGTVIEGGQVGLSGTNAIGIYFYNTAVGVYRGGRVQDVVFENFVASGICIRVDGATARFDQVLVSGIRADLAVGANQGIVVDFQRAGYGTVLYPIFYSPAGTATAVNWGANSVECTVVGNSPGSTLGPYTVDGSATRASVHILSSMSEASIATVDTDSNLTFLVDWLSEWRTPMIHDGTDWRKLDTSRTSTAVMTGGETMTAEDGNVWIRDPNGAHRNLSILDADFFPGEEVTVINTAAGAFNLMFDSAGINEAVGQGERGIFRFDGTDWYKVYVGS